MNLLEQQVNELRAALNSEMKAKDDILNEARSRIEQYEKRLTELKNESDQYKLQADESGAQLMQLKAAATANDQQAGNKTFFCKNSNYPPPTSMLF